MRKFNLRFLLPTKKFLMLSSLVILCGLILSLSLRGLPGNPNGETLNSSVWQGDGPFELSPERGRFALLYTLVENHSFQFPDAIGKFAIPDVAVSKGKYVSLFAPLLSFVAIPGYVIGKYFGASQVGTFAMISVVALLNVILLRLIAIRLGADSIAATIASLVFLFGTPAFSYAVTLYQHHLSTFLILLSIYALLKSNKAWSLIVVFFVCALAIPLDYPNLFFMFPISIFALGRIISFESIKSKLSVRINLFKLLTPLVMILPILFFLWFNQASYGNPFQLSGTLPSARHLLDNVSGNPNTSTQLQALSTSNRSDTALKFFQTRYLLNGFYIHFVSPDRGVIYYAPVVLFGIIGFFLSLRKNVQMTPLLASIVGANILLYSMWGDPYGGWAFGSRYLIPAYAILSIFIALFLTYWRKSVMFLAGFLLVAFYSIAVNTLGAITTNAIPPQVEVLNLEKLSGLVQKYTYAKNWDILVAGHSKSFVYQTFLKNYLSAIQFYQILIVSIFIFVGGLISYYYAHNNKGE